MQDRVRGINRVIEASKNNRDNNRARLASLVTNTDLERCSNFIEKVREERYNRVKVRQVRKFQIPCGKSRQHSNNNVRHLNTNRSGQGVNANRLGPSKNRQNHNSQSEGIGNYKWVINLSKTSLTQAQKSVLAKGPNYAITPNNIPNVDYITAIESMCPKLKEENAMELRADINSLLRKAKVPKSNLTGQEKIGLSQLKKDKDRLILTADKGWLWLLWTRRIKITKHKSY